MKSAKYRLSEKALRDLNTIWEFTALNWSHEQADRYYQLIMDEIAYICKYPFSGRPVNYARGECRVSKIKSHLIFYRQSQHNIIEVIRILHERMDIINRLYE